MHAHVHIPRQEDNMHAHVHVQVEEAPAQTEKDIVSDMANDVAPSFALEVISQSPGLGRWISMWEVGCRK